MNRMGHRVAHGAVLKFTRKTQGVASAAQSLGSGGAIATSFAEASPPAQDDPGRESDSRRINWPPNWPDIFKQWRLFGRRGAAHSLRPRGRGDRGTNFVLHLIHGK